MARRLPVRMLAAVLPLCFPNVALAESPTRPIEVVVPFSAGGGTDIMARLFANALEKKLDSPVVVVNLPGAGGEIGMADVANGTTDGSRLVVLNTPNILTIPIERDARFSVESFELIGTIADDPATLSVRASGEIQSIEALVEAAKADGSRLTYGSSGVGSAGHIAMLLFQNAAGIEAVNVPFDGSSAVRNGLLNGDVTVATANLGEALTFSEGADWHILGVMAARRVDGQPDVPTFAEVGFPVTGGSLRGLGVAKGTPPEVLERLRTAMAEVMSDEEFLEAAARADVPIRYLTPQHYADELSAQAGELKALWDRTPWK